MIIFQPVRQFSAVNGTPRFIIIFMGAYNQCRTWITWIQTTPSHCISIRPIFYFASTSCILNGVLSSDLQLEQSPVMDSYKRSNEPLGSIKCGNFLMNMAQMSDRVWMICLCDWKLLTTSMEKMCTWHLGCGWWEMKYYQSEQETEFISTGRKTKIHTIFA